MPRKSAALRLSQAKELYASYQEAGLEGMKGGRFIRDMVFRLDRGRGLSKGQRNWLDSLIEEGVPQPKGNRELLSKIDDAIATVGMESKAGILNDFRFKIYNGWDLSPKQSKWLQDMLTDAEDLKINGPWMPDENQIQLMRDIAALSRGYNSAYWSTHGGTYRAVGKIRDFLEVYDSEYDDKNLIEKRLSAVGLDEWSITKAAKSMRGRLQELREKPYAEVGSLVWTRYRADGARWNDLQWFQAPVCGPPTVSDRGQVVYPVLNPVAGLIEVTKDQITKRKPRR